jgi:hypothetical protein
VCTVHTHSNPGTTVIIGDILFHFTIFSFIFIILVCRSPIPRSSLYLHHQSVFLARALQVHHPCTCSNILFTIKPSECSLPVHFIILPCQHTCDHRPKSCMCAHTYTHTTYTYIHDMHSTGVLSKLLLSCLLGPWRTTVIVVLLRPQHGFPPQQS